jgi:hypothetical protein
MFSAFKKKASPQVLSSDLSSTFQTSSGPPLIGVTAQTFMDSQKHPSSDLTKSSKKDATSSDKPPKKKRKIIPDQL